MSIPAAMRALQQNLWHDHDTYDPNRRTARQRLTATSAT